MRTRCAVVATAGLWAFAVACGDDDPPAAGAKKDLEPATDPTGAGDGTSNGTSGGLPPGDGGPVDAARAGSSPLVQARPYALTVPLGYDANVATPLVLLLHGYTATAKEQDDYFRMSALAQEKKFLVALPDGKRDLIGNPFWDATNSCCNFTGTPVDDSSYLKAVIDDVKATHNVDPKRVFVVGHSNGGFMANRLACDHAAMIAGIVSLAGSTWNDAARCPAGSPVAVLQIHGTDDETVGYTGGPFLPGLPPYPSAAGTVARWAAKNGCDATLANAGERRDIVVNQAGEETRVERHACAAGRGAAELWTIEGGEHVPELQPSFAAMIWAFLEAHPKP